VEKKRMGSKEIIKKPLERAEIDGLSGLMVWDGAVTEFERDHQKIVDGF
jgi:hypothetical protein